MGPRRISRRRIQIALEPLEARTLLSTVSYLPHPAVKPAATHVAAAKPANRVGTWTVMVYITGDNLNESLAKNILQMENLAAQLPPSVKILAFWSQPTNQISQGEYLHPVFNTGDNSQVWTDGVTVGMGVIQGARHILPTGNKNLPPIQTRFELSARNSGDPATLEDFMLYARAVAPAKHYAMILSDHGDSINGFNVDKNYTPNSGLDVPKLVSALGNARSAGVKLDLLAFDECMMASAEVEFGVRRLVPYVVASQELVPGAGYNYQDALSSLTHRPRLVNARILAKKLVKSYGAQDRHQTDNGDTLSAVDTRRLNALAAGLRRLVRDTASLGNRGWNVIQQARSESAVYGISGDSPYRDLGQFLRHVKTYAPRPRLRQNAAFALAALRRSVIATTRDQRGSLGLQVVLPQTPEIIPQNYIGKAAAFVRNTNWHNFLNRFQAKTSAAPSSEQRDWAEYNNKPRSATNVYEIPSGIRTVLPQLTLTSHDVDWYKFRLGSPQSPGAFIQAIIAPGDQSDLRLQLYRMAKSNSPSVNGLDPIPIASGTTSLSLDNVTTGGDYFLEVSHSDRGPGVGYSLAFDTKAQRATDVETFPAGNLTSDTSYNIGTVSIGGIMTVTEGADSSQVLARSNPAQLAWYQFATPRSEAPMAGSFTVQGLDDPSQLVAVSLFDQSGKLLRHEQGSGEVTVNYQADGGAEAFYFAVGGDAGHYQIFFNTPTTV